MSHDHADTVIMYFSDDGSVSASDKGLRAYFLRGGVERGFRRIIVECWTRILILKHPMLVCE